MDSYSVRIMDHGFNWHPLNTHIYTRTNRSTDRPSPTSKETINFSETTLQGRLIFRIGTKRTAFTHYIVQDQIVSRAKERKAPFSFFCLLFYFRTKTHITPPIHPTRPFSFGWQVGRNKVYAFFGFPCFLSFPLFPFLRKTLRRTHERHRKIQLKKYRV